MIQTWALIVDAYRELSAKKLFWITLMLSGLVVSVMGIFGLSPKGLTVLWWEFPLPLLNSTTISPAVFYKFVFANLGVPIWLTWIASVLALISTASIVPDFIAGGAIELTLSKPIGRLRLFLTKYFTGLLFVGLQVGVFTAACFFVIGLRGKSWEWGIWLAVPIVLLCFSYLYSACALLGLLTRSTITSLLLTLLLWFAIWLMNTADAVMLMQREQSQLRLEQNRKILDRRTKKVREEFQKADTNETPPATDLDSRVAAHPLVVQATQQVADAQESVTTWSHWARIVYITKTILPKTTETTGLLERHLISLDELKKLMPGDDDEPASDDEPAPRHRPRNRNGAQARVEAALRERSVWWIAGTSVAFEVVVLSIACVVFCRRDF